MTAGSVPNRAARLKALGNAVVPQDVYPIAYYLRQLMIEIDAVPLFQAAR